MPEFPVIPGYRIEKELGRGGMATVYLAHEEKLERLVALKVLEILSAQGRDLAERFIREAKTAAKLQHSNIVSIFDVGKADNLYYMAVEYLRGGTLREKLRSGPMEPAQALRIAAQMAEALGYAHCQGFIHRDIKPDNIMFRNEGQAVLTDFGIARAVDSATKLTKTGMSVGTPHYMSPEQARGQAVDARSDLYSLGIVLFEMLTGKVPYEAEDSVAIAIKHIQEPVPVLADSVGARRAVPSDLSRYQLLIDKLLAKSPAGRVQDAAGLVRMIDGFVEARSVSSPMPKNETPATPQPKPRQESRIHVAGPSVQKKTLDAKSGKLSAVSQKGMVEPKRKKMIGVLVGILSVLVVILYLVISSKKETSPDIYSPSSSTIRLRSTFKTLNDDEAKSMAKRLGIYMSDWNPSASGISHQYQSRTISGDRVVVDGTTGLMWHQSGSDKYFNYAAAQAWLDELNRRGYAGYSDWRLPTLEEGASLLESSERNGDLYIDPVFSNSQRYIWTGDSYSSAASWAVGFNDGSVDGGLRGSGYYVRPVRSGK